MTRRVLRGFAVLLSIVAGILIGAVVTTATLHGDPPFGAVRGGVWTAWPMAGTPSADPYERAIASRTGQLPLSATGGLRFLARWDDGGRRLEGRCSYRVDGPIPTAEFWTLTVLTPDGRPRLATDARSGFTSSEVIRGDDGSAVITLARQARPGNWLPTRGDDAFALMLSLYDTPLGAVLAAGGPLPAMPRIARLDCP